MGGILSLQAVIWTRAEIASLAPPALIANTHAAGADAVVVAVIRAGTDGAVASHPPGVAGAGAIVARALHAAVGRAHHLITEGASIAGVAVAGAIEALAVMVTVILTCANGAILPLVARWAEAHALLADSNL